jgi:hypothetical protein
MLSESVPRIALRRPVRSPDMQYDKPRRRSVQMLQLEHPEHHLRTCVTQRIWLATIAWMPCFRSTTAKLHLQMLDIAKIIFRTVSAMEATMILKKDIMRLGHLCTSMWLLITVLYMPQESHLQISKPSKVPHTIATDWGTTIL